MARRKVTKSRKDKLGNITHLCKPFESWSPRSSWDVISDIEVRLHSYFVMVDYQEVDITVVDGAYGKYLRTDQDKTKKNNLDELLDC